MIRVGQIIRVRSDAPGTPSTRERFTVTGFSRGYDGREVVNVVDKKGAHRAFYSDEIEPARPTKAQREQRKRAMAREGS